MDNSQELTKLHTGKRWSLIYRESTENVNQKGCPCVILQLRGYMSRGEQPLSDRRAFQCPADQGKTTCPKAGACEAYVLRGQDVYPCAAIAQGARLRGRAKGLLPP